MAQDLALLDGRPDQEPDDKPKAPVTKDWHKDILSAALRAREHRSVNWDPRWEELAEYFHPDREGFTSNPLDGEERRDGVYGSPPEIAARSLASTVSTMLRPPGKVWFKAKPRNVGLEANEAVRMWCEDVTRITYAYLYDPKAQFEKQCAEADRDICVFGTGVIQPGWNARYGHLTFRCHHLKQVALATDAAGQHDMAFVFWKYTIRQLMQDFADHELPESIREKINQTNPNLDAEHEVVHICIPAKDATAFGGKMKFPYLSLWMSVPDKTVMREKGYYEFPYVTPRWDTTTGEVYGRSPAMVALRDARLLDAMTRGFVDGAELALMPPQMAPMQMIRSTIDLRPRGVTIYDPSGMPAGTKPLEPVQLGTLPDKMYEFMMRLEERINQAFFRDILELPRADEGDMTAAEIYARQDQYLRQAAPVFTRLEANYNGPLVNRVFSILMREGAYPPPPEELYDQDIEFEYESPVKAARDKAEALKIMEGLQMIQQIAAGSPDPMQVADNLDFDVVTRLVAIRADLPQAILKPLQAMLEERAARAKKMEQMQMAEMAAKAGPAVAKLADSVTKAKQGGVISTDDPAPIGMQGFDPTQMVVDGEFEEIAP